MGARAPRPVPVEHLLAAWPPARLAAALDDALAAWRALDLRESIVIRWNSRLRTTVGRALLDRLVVELNPRLLARHPEQVRHVLLHEAAHLVVRCRFGPRTPPHGRIWKDHMRLLGESTRATHQLDVRGLRAPRRRRPPARGRVRSLWRLLGVR